MSIRCLMRLQDVIPLKYGGRKVIFNCQYDQKLAEEGRAFQLATPTGMAEFIIDNPAAIAQLVIDEYYYVDFTQRPDPAVEKPG